MSLYDYQVSKQISMQDDPFAALIMAALRQAGTQNAATLRAAFPEIASELQARYDTPGGLVIFGPCRNGHCGNCADGFTNGGVACEHECHPRRDDQ